jgi:hypothetical protein
VRRQNRTATRRTIVALRYVGRLAEVDEAVVGLAQATADLLDEAIADPDEKTYAVAAIGRLHLAALMALQGRESGDVDAGLSEVIAALSTPLGYAGDRSP